MTFSEASEILAACNHTELYQACRGANLPVRPDMSRDELARALYEGVAGEGGESPFDPWRLAIMAFLLDHWERVRSQLSCPARSGDPRACFECTDTQVIACLVGNADEEYAIRQHLIQLKRKP